MHILICQDAIPKRYCIEIEFGAIGIRYHDIETTKNDLQMEKDNVNLSNVNIETTPWDNVIRHTYFAFRLRYLKY